MEIFTFFPKLRSFPKHILITTKEANSYMKRGFQNIGRKCSDKPSKDIDRTPYYDKYANL